jgi:hypothetical protein
MEFFAGMFALSLFIVITIACVVVSVIGVGWYDAGSAFDLQAYFLNSRQGDWNWPGVSIAHSFIDAGTAALNIDTSLPIISSMISLVGAVIAVYINTGIVMLLLWSAVFILHNVVTFTKWLWKHAKKLQLRATTH